MGERGLKSSFGIQDSQLLSLDQGPLSSSSEDRHFHILFEKVRVGITADKSFLFLLSLRRPGADSIKLSRPVSTDCTAVNNPKDAFTDVFLSDQL